MKRGLSCLKGHGVGLEVHRSHNNSSMITILKLWTPQPHKIFNRCQPLIGGICSSGFLNISSSASRIGISSSGSILVPLRSFHPAYAAIIIGISL
jgi:hypothetical protein